MLNLIKRPFVSAAVLGLAISAVPVQAEPVTIANSNSIQPETTISITATAQEMVAPDMAYLTGGVVTEAKTAGEWCQQQVKTGEEEMLKLMEAEGVQITNPDPAPFRAMMDPAWAAMRERIGNETWETWMGFVDAARVA